MEPHLKGEFALLWVCCYLIFKESNFIKQMHILCIEVKSNTLHSIISKCLVFLQCTAIQESGKFLLFRWFGGFLFLVCVWLGLCWGGFYFVGFLFVLFFKFTYTFMYTVNDTAAQAALPRTLDIQLSILNLVAVTQWYVHILYFGQNDMGLFLSVMRYTINCLLTSGTQYSDDFAGS